MSGSETRAFRPKLTLTQMMKLVIFGAIASACLAPMVHLAEIGVGSWAAVVVMGGVTVPLVLALASFHLVRVGPLKDWSIRSLLATSLSVALGFGVWTLFSFGLRAAGRGSAWDYLFLAEVIGVILVLGSGLGFLLRGMIPRRCPECHRRTLLPDRLDRGEAGSERGRPSRCIACNVRAWEPRGSWRASRRPGTSSIGSEPFA